MKKDLSVIFGLFLIVLILILLGGDYTSTFFLDQNRKTTQQVAGISLINIVSGSLNINAELAKSPEITDKGLSGRDSLALDYGMLFVFDSSAMHTFWMKDMKFAIDIIWIDENKKIVNIAENVSPQPDVKDSDLTRYSAQSPSKYVLVINAGLSKNNNLKIGDFVNFSL